MRQDLWEERFTHTSQTRSPYILLHLLVWQQDEPPQLNNLGRAIYHKAALEAIENSEDRRISLFLGGSPQSIQPPSKVQSNQVCIKVISFQSF